MANQDDFSANGDVKPLASEQQAPSPSLLDYFNYPTADRLQKVKELIRQHEEKHFSLALGLLSIEGNPDQGTHHEVDPDDPKAIPCQCGPCEVARIRNGMAGLEYAINQLKAICAQLSG